MSLRSILKEKFKPFYCIWYGKRKDTWKKTRYCSGAFMGAFCAWLICKCMFLPFNISKQKEHYIMLRMILIVATGYVFTDTIKCITLMMFISLMGKSGRSYMRALSFAFVISGPIENLSSNTGEIIRSFSCSKVLVMNLTRTRFDLMTKPFQNTLVHMKEDIEEVQNTFNDLKDVTRDLHKEVMSSEDNETLKRTDHQGSAEDIQNRYKNKFRKRCYKQLDNGKARCRKAFLTAFEKCYDKMPFIIRTIICWPLKVDFICNINVFGNPETICDPSDALPDNFGETYVELVSTEDQIFEDSSSIKVNYTIMSPEKMMNLKSTEETAKNMVKEFKSRKIIFDSIVTIMQQFLGMMILKILYASFKYHKKYKKELDHDNIYITEYFKHVDERRKAQGKKPLLPLKKYERRNLIDADQTWHRTHEESQAATFHLLQFFLEILTGGFFLFLDYVVVSVLLIIRDNSEMSFVQEGEHTIHFKIQGVGLIARLLRKTMGNFNMNETVSTYLTNEPCLPNPTILPLSYYLKLMFLYILILLLIYHSSSFLRMRRIICGYFYRKIEKRRILFLYNSLMKQRRYLRETMIREAKANFAHRQIRLKTNIFLIMRLKWPNYCNCLMKFHMGRRKCIICGELEDSKFVFCKNSECKVAYCKDCFNDIEDSCWICNDILSVNIILNFNDFFQEFSFI